VTGENIGSDMLFYPLDRNEASYIFSRTLVLNIYGELRR
jgi:hypothetical protein